jgi:hypothetical protein
VLRFLNKEGRSGSSPRVARSLSLSFLASGAHRKKWRERDEGGVRRSTVLTGRRGI